MGLKNSSYLDQVFPKGRVGRGSIAVLRLLFAAASGVSRNPRVPSASGLGRGFLVLATILTTACGSDPLQALRRDSLIQAPDTAPSTATFKTLNPRIFGNQYKFIFSIDES